MTLTTFTSREFNQDTARAKKAAVQGPVVITDRGEPSHVLLSYERYLALSGRGADLVELLGMPDGADIAFEAPRATVAGRVPDLS